MTTRFRNPANGYEEEVGIIAGLWCLLFGFFYFVVKGIWTHAVGSYLLAIVTSGISWFIYPFFAFGIVEQHYLRRGWQRVGGPSTIEPADERLMRVAVGGRVGKAGKIALAVVVIGLFFGFALLLAP